MRTPVFSLRDIRITAEITDAVDKDKDITHELDLKYTKLNCKIEPLDPSSKEYQTLVQTLDINHPSTNYFKIKCLEIFKLCREGEAEKFKKDIGNRKLFWHGSTFSNWGGILSQGLRIAPPEAPACGYMLGKGVYFADVIYKSACFTRYGLSNNIGLLALCDVAIGKTNDQINGDSTITLNNLPKGTNTTRGCGRYVPTKTQELNGSMLQLGPLKDDEDKTWITHNEFILLTLNFLTLL